MSTFDILALASTLMLSLLVPVGIFNGRNNIRILRREIVSSLEVMFDFAKDDEGKAIVIPSFELIKYKYEGKQSENGQDPHSLFAYFFPVSIYIMLCFVGLYCAFVLPGYQENAFTSVFVAASGDVKNNLHSLQMVEAYTFIAGYMWSIQYLIRRIGNFDLAPISFFQAAAHILMGLFVSAALWQSGLSSKLGSLSVALAFLVGFSPLLALDALFARFPWLRLKKINPDGKRLAEDIPLDLILGIDPFMKLRLGEFAIADVQNLATINPIQIFVETPYGLYEVIDWVAQAQLILAVGPHRTFLLRDIGVRTIFDLEKALYSQPLRQRLHSILLSRSNQRIRDEQMILCSDATGARSVRSDCPGSETGLDLNFELDAIVSILRDDLHVRRLRQIWDVINAQLDQRPSKTALKTIAVPPGKGANGASMQGGVSPDGTSSGQDNTNMHPENRSGQREHH